MYKTRLDELIEGAYHALKTSGKTIVRIISNGQFTNTVVKELQRKGLPFYIAVDNVEVQNAAAQLKEDGQPAKQPAEYEINLKEIQVDDDAVASEEYCRLKRLYRAKDKYR